MEERVIPVEELMDADEVFCTGTAVVVNPVGSVTYRGVEAASQKLYAMLTGMQTGRFEDKMGWTVEID
nr:branched-chain-amino-acid aminotransferase 3, chloroplastic [Quercus suber]POF22877.1 branched-chain-amino-acid aminotransferase 3, chloroplastic [Quercus suber]